MTFESEVSEKLDIVQEEAVVKTDKDPCFSVLFNFVHLGPAVDGKLAIADHPGITFRLQPGFNRIPVLLPVTKDSSRYTAIISFSGKEHRTAGFLCSSGQGMDHIPRTACTYGYRIYTAAD
jgi:hypothetical protein